ncbi:MAG: DNA-binding protein [Candidatus Micrarchaeota archaeon]
MMKISELKPGATNVEVKGEIVELEQPREINKMGRTLRVANASLKDASGTITLTLWNDSIDQVQVGSVVHITNAYVNTWQDKTQLTLGKFGKMEAI